MRTFFSTGLCVVVGVLLTAEAGPVAQTTDLQSANPGRLAVASRTPAELRDAETIVGRMMLTRELIASIPHDDPQIPGRRHENLQQFHRGVPVYGGGVTRQLSDTSTISVLGTLLTGIDIDTTPALSSADATARFLGVSGRDFAFGESPLLVIYPVPTGRYALAYRATMANAMTYVIDAQTGEVLQAESERAHQSVVGIGTGVLGDSKKMVTTKVGAAFRTQDQLRPFRVQTYDTGGSEDVLDRMLDVNVAFDTDYPTDDDNVWTNGAVVDTHTNVGLAADYFFRRHQWSGANGLGSTLMAIVHSGLNSNAFFTSAPFGPERAGALVFGRVPGGGPLTTLDIVGHELMHSVTFYSVGRRTGRGLSVAAHVDRLGPATFRLNNDSFSCDTTVLIFSDGTERPFLCTSGRYVLASNPGGTINEAFSDIFGTAVEAFYQQPGSGPLRADYANGEDVTGLGVRSASTPSSARISTFAGGELSYPDHVAKQLGYALYITAGTRALPIAVAYSSIVFVGDTAFQANVDRGGEHYNATLLSHAMFLAIEGGTNATSGRRVTGVGFANRGQIEQACFRAVTQLMPQAPDLPTAASAIYQAAVDLFGSSSAPARAVSDAMIAVGLVPAS